MYIALEGIDTSGKSTQINLLKQAFKEAIITKEPGGSALGEQIREIILKEHSSDKNSCLDRKTEFLLFLCDRSEHIAKVIKPNQNKLIISDRSLISGIAYAMDIQEAQVLNLFATDNIKPDLVIILKLDETTLQNRLSQKSNDAIEKRGIKYLLDIQNNIINATKALQCPLEIIDAAEPIDSIFSTIKTLIQKRI